MNDRHVLPPYSLRMPADLREKLEASSQQAKRSLNAEIVARLEASYDFIPQSMAISMDEGVSELNELNRQQAAISALQIAKIRALVDLKAELNDSPSPEERAALLAASTVAQSEIDSLSAQRTETLSKYEKLRAALKLNSRAPREE